MFGKLGDMAGMLKKAQEIQQNMGRMQEELAEIEVSGKSGCGRVEVVLSCDMQAKGVTISQSCIDTADPEIVETLLIEAINSALEAAKVQAKEKMLEITGGVMIFPE